MKCAHEAVYIKWKYLRLEHNHSGLYSAEVNFLGEVLEFEILNVLEFTSDRKRMSVVVRDCAAGSLHLLTKGADETVFRILRAGKLALSSILNL